MSQRVPFEYAVLRVVPRVERAEFLNVGVVVYCQRSQFLAAAIELDTVRLHAFAPSLDADDVRASLRAVELVCEGGIAAGEAGGGDIGQRFRWLTAPRSTVVQPSPVHTGVTTDAPSELRRLLDTLVSPA